jgi:hypothetical protein
MSDPQIQAHKLELSVCFDTFCYIPTATSLLFPCLVPIPSAQQDTSKQYPKQQSPSFRFPRDETCPLVSQNSQQQVSDNSTKHSPSLFVRKKLITNAHHPLQINKSHLPYAVLNNHQERIFPLLPGYLRTSKSSLFDTPKSTATMAFPCLPQLTHILFSLRAPTTPTTSTQSHPIPKPIHTGFVSRAEPTTLLVTPRLPTPAQVISETQRGREKRRCAKRQSV